MFPIKDTIPSERFPAVTLCLIGINCAVFFWQTALSQEEMILFFEEWGLVPARLVSSLRVARETPVGSGIAGQILTVFSSMFLHGGFLHLFANMWSLWLFGDNVEDLMGRGRFLLFYFLSGLIAAFTHVIVSPTLILPTVGASGAVSGVMGAYLFMFPRSTLLMVFPLFFIPIFFEISAVLYLVFWFLSQFFMGTQVFLSDTPVGGIAFWAHIGGFVAGALVHRLFVIRKARAQIPGKTFKPRRSLRRP